MGNSHWFAAFTWGRTAHLQELVVEAGRVSIKGKHGGLFIIFTLGRSPPFCTCLDLELLGASLDSECLAASKDDLPFLHSILRRWLACIFSDICELYRALDILSFALIL